LMHLPDARDLPATADAQPWIRGDRFHHRVVDPILVLFELSRL
jgi:hypothetical protein